MDASSQFSGSSTITFEWTLQGLKDLFDSTQGDEKSKVTKSTCFGNNQWQWQILFYANSGRPKEGVDFVSLYLACEPTLEEKEATLANSEKWVRDGAYNFTFELRHVGKTDTFLHKEAQNHHFSWKTPNWGWAQFAPRDSIYYQNVPAQSDDALVIICIITPSTPSPTHQ